MTGHDLLRGAALLNLVALVAYASCASPLRDPPVVTVEGSAMSPADLALRVRGAIREAGYLRFEGVAEGVVWPWRDGDPERYGIRFVQEMERDRLKLGLSSREGTPLLTVLYGEDVVTEFCPSCEPPTGAQIHDLRSKVERWKLDSYLLERVCTNAGDCGLLATYSAPWEDGMRVAGTREFTIGGDRITFAQACLIGSRSASWIAPDDDQAEVFHRWVRDGRILTPEQTISGRRCIPVMWSQTRMGFPEDPDQGWPGVPPSQTIHILYFDAQNYQLVRWDSLVMVLESPLYVNPRTKVHQQILVMNQAPVGTWELALPSFARRETVFAYPE